MAGKTFKNAPAPVYVVNGAAGCREKISHGFHNPPPANSRVRSYEYGFARLDVNATALAWTYYNEKGGVVDEFVIQK